jgi:hypothetical protein
LNKNDQKNSNDFVVNKPSILLSKLRTKKTNMNQIETELKDNLVWFGSQFNGQNISKILKISSKNDFIAEFIRAYSDASEDILFFGSTSSFLDVVGLEVINLVTEERKKNKIKHKILTCDKLLANIDNKKLGREVHYWQDSKPLKSMSYSIIGSTTFFWNMIEPCCYIIEDRFLSDLMRFQFMNIWDHKSVVEL